MGMTAEERLQTVIKCEKPDRVPVAPMIYYFAAFYAGITVHELWSDWKKYEMAIQKCYNELGPWDVYYNICPVSPEAYQTCLLMKVIDLCINNAMVNAKNMVVRIGGNTIGV